MSLNAELKLEIEYATRTPFPYVLLKGKFQQHGDKERPIHIGVTLTPSGRAPFISGIQCEGTVKEREVDHSTDKLRTITRSKKSWQARLCVELDTIKELLTDPPSAGVSEVFLSWKPSVEAVCHSLPTFFGVDPHVHVLPSSQGCK